MPFYGKFEQSIAVLKILCATDWLPWRSRSLSLVIRLLLDTNLEHLRLAEFFPSVDSGSTSSKNWFYRVFLQSCHDFDRFFQLSVKDT